MVSFSSHYFCNKFPFSPRQENGLSKRSPDLCWFLRRQIKTQSLSPRTWPASEEACTTDKHWSLSVISVKVNPSLGCWATWELFWGQNECCRLMLPREQRLTLKEGGSRTSLINCSLLPKGGQPHSFWSWLNPIGYVNKKLGKRMLILHFSSSVRGIFFPLNCLPTPTHSSSGEQQSLIRLVTLAQVILLCLLLGKLSYAESTVLFR